MKTWLDGELARVSAKSALAEAIRYALRHWNGLSLLLEEGRVEIDSNTVERTIRPIKPAPRTTSSPAPMAAPKAGPSSPL
jgi:hypothetical protein